MKVKLAIVDRLQEIIRESVRPMERIEGIKILQVDGLNGGAGAPWPCRAGTTTIWPSRWSRARFATVPRRPSSMRCCRSSDWRRPIPAA